MAKVNPQKLSAIHQQLSNLKIDLLDTKVLITKQQASASKFTISIAKQLFKFIDQYKEKQFSQLLQISQCSKRLVDQVLAYKSIHIEQNNFIQFFEHTLPLIDDIFEALTKELLLLQVKIKDIAVSSAFSPQEEESKILVNMSHDSNKNPHHQLMENSNTLEKVLGLISTESRKRDKDFVLELIKRQFSVKDGSKQGEFSLKKHCRNMTLTEMERYVCSLINNSYHKNLPGLPVKSSNQSKVRYKNDVSLDDILAISNSKVPLTLRLKDWEQASACPDSNQSTVIDVKSVITGTKSILKLFEQSPAPPDNASGSQNNKKMFINSNGIQIPFDPKKIKKIQFSGSFKKPKDDGDDQGKTHVKSKSKDLPFTHSQIDQLVFAEDDTMQLSKAMQDRRKKLLEDDNSSFSQLQREQLMEESFTVSTSVTGKNVDAVCDKSLASDIENKFQKYPLDIYANNHSKLNKVQKSEVVSKTPQKIRKPVKMKQSSSSFITDAKSGIDNSFRQKYSHNDEKQMLQKVQRIETPIRLKKNGMHDIDKKDEELESILQIDNSSKQERIKKELNEIKKASGEKFNNKQLITIESIKQTSLSSSSNNNNKISISSRKILSNDPRNNLANSGRKILKKSNSKSYHKTFQPLSSSSQQNTFSNSQTKNKVFNYQAASFSSSTGKHHHNHHNFEENKILSDFSGSTHTKNKQKNQNNLYISNIEDDDDQDEDEIFQRQFQNKVNNVLVSQQHQTQSKKSFDLFSSRNKAHSALGFNSDMIAKSSNGESKTNHSPKKGQGVLRSLMHHQQQGRTTTATSISEQQLPPIESHRTVGVRDKNSLPHQYNPTRVVLEKKLRKIIELQNMSVPQSPKAKFESENGKLKKNGVRHPIGYESERASVAQKKLPSTRSSVVGIKAGPEIIQSGRKQQPQKMKEVRMKSKKN